MVVHYTGQIRPLTVAGIGNRSVYEFIMRFHKSVSVYAYNLSHGETPSSHLGILLLAAIILFIRKTDAFLNPQFWAEDFWPFFVDADLFGSDMLLRGYNGYCHLAPRLIAWASAHYDPVFQPALYVGASFAITMSVVALALSPRLNLIGKKWLALAIVAVPHTGEVFLNPTNLQWILALGFLLILLKSDPVTRLDWVADVLWLTVISLTGPFGVLFFPLFIWRASKRRSFGSLILTLILAIPVAFQAWQLVHAPEIVPADRFNWMGLISLMSARIPATFLVGAPLSFRLGYATVVVIGLLSLVLLLAAIVRKTPSRETQVVALIALVLVVIAAVRRIRPDTWAFDDIVNGDRYLYVPKVLSLWLFVLVFIETKALWIRRTLLTVVAIGVIGNISSFRFSPLPDLYWASYCDKIRAGQKVVIPINPGWTKEYPGKIVK